MTEYERLQRLEADIARPALGGRPPVRLLTGPSRKQLGEEEAANKAMRSIKIQEADAIAEQLEMAKQLRRR